MNQEFNKLQDEYQKALQEQNEEQQVEIVSRMRANLLQRNNDEELILLSQEGIKLNINTAFIKK